MPSSFSFFYLFFCGFCMGMADLTPGISGGTVAFMMGFYEPLLNHLKSINGTALKLLFSRNLKGFRNQIGWSFLLPLALGILTALLLFAEWVHAVLGSADGRTYLYSCFFGLITAGGLLSLKSIKRLRLRLGIVFIIGCSLAALLTEHFHDSPSQGPFAIKIANVETSVPLLNYDPSSQLLTGLTSNDLRVLELQGVIDRHTPIFSTHTHEEVVTTWGETHFSPLIDEWMVVCGALAICALLLPGISGSYLLTILGAYPVVIEALAEFSASLKQGSFDAPSFSILFSLFLGILCGIMLFSRSVSWILTHYYDASISLLSGFMLGSLSTLWPFYTYAYRLIPGKLEKGAQLIPLEPIWPNQPLLSIGISLFLILFSFMTVLWVEKKQNRNDQIALSDRSL